MVLNLFTLFSNFFVLSKCLLSFSKLLWKYNTPPPLNEDLISIPSKVLVSTPNKFLSSTLNKILISNPNKILTSAPNNVLTSAVPPSIYYFWRGGKIYYLKLQSIISFIRYFTIYYSSNSWSFYVLFYVFWFDISFLPFISFYNFFIYL